MKQLLELNPRITNELRVAIDKGICLYCKQKADVEEDDISYTYTHLDHFPDGQYRSWYHKVRK